MDVRFWGERGIFFAPVDGDRPADAIAVNNDGLWVRKASSSALNFGSAANWTSGGYFGQR